VPLAASQGHFFVNQYKRTFMIEIFDKKGFTVIYRTDLPRLRNADLQGVNLKDANLVQVDLSGADLRNANLEGADLRLANLEKADLRGAMLQGADLGGAKLENAQLDPRQKTIPISVA
jgi:hypothetical protein